MSLGINPSMFLWLPTARVWLRMRGTPGFRKFWRNQLGSPSQYLAAKPHIKGRSTRLGLRSKFPSFVDLNMDPSKMEDTKEDLNTVPSQIDLNHDDVFGELREDGPNYRNVRAIFLYSEQLAF